MEILLGLILITQLCVVRRLYAIGDQLASRGE